jgi:hypothetical protein
MPPRRAVVNLTLLYRKTACVNTIESEQGKRCGKAAGGLSLVLLKHIVYCQFSRQPIA